MKEMSLSAYDDYEYIKEGENTSEGLFSPFTFLCFTLILFLMGIVTLYSSSFEKCISLGLEHFLMLKLQLFGVAGGFLCGIILCFLPKVVLKRIHYFLFVVFSFIVISCLFYQEFADSKNLIRVIGVVGAVTIIFQLSDFIPQIRTSEIRGIPLVIAAMTTCSIMFFSTLLGGSGWFLVDALIVLGIMNSYGVRHSYIAFVCVFFMVSLVFLLSYFPGVFTSFSSSIFPVFNSDLYSREIYVSRMAIRDGGLFGLGLGKGISKLGLLANPEGEFIMATLLEETGIIGLLPYLVSLFIVYVIGVRTAGRARRKNDDYCASCVVGFIVLFVFGSVFCILRTIGLNPFGGVELPLFSFNPIYEGIILAILCLLYKYIHMMGRNSKREK